MKKTAFIFSFFCLMSFVFPAFSQTKDTSTEKNLSINENTALDCYRCDPKSKNPPLCINCLFDGRIRLKDNSILEGKITAVKGNIAQVKIPYGAMEINIDTILPPEEVPESVTKPASPQIPPSSPEPHSKTSNPVIPSPSSPPVNDTLQKNLQKTDLRPSKQTSPVSLKNMLKQTRWITYTPSTYIPDKEDQLNSEDIRKDLVVLRSASFNGLITYTSVKTMAQIPSIARETGFERIIMGVWDPRDEKEINNALSASAFVDGYCIGHEGIFRKEYSKEDVIRVMKDFREKTGKPVTTSDNMSIVMNSENKDLLEACDWIFLIAYFMFDENLKKKTPEKGIKWIQDVERNVDAQLHLKKPLMFKEIGFPSKGENWTDEKNQEKFLKSITKSNISFALFDAFDQSWKTDSSISPNWGIFKADRTPKRYAQYRIDRPIRS